MAAGSSYGARTLPNYQVAPTLLGAIRSSGAGFNDQVLALAAALVESSGRLDAVGDGGRSHGPYQEYDLGRGAGLSIAQRRDPVASTQRFLRELRTFRQRGFTGAELVYRTQRPADHAGYVRKINAAIPQARTLLGQGGGALPPGASPGLMGAAPTDSPAGPSGLRLTPALERKLSAYLVRTRNQVMAGVTPDDALPLVQGLSRLAAQQAASTAGTGAAPAIMDLQGRTGGGTAQAGLTAAGGGWGGTEAPALAIAKVSGLPITSQKRDRKFTASGGVSDHWVGSKTSYAVDLGTSGAAGDAAFKRIVTALGYPHLQPGKWHNLNIGGFRYQIGWRTPGHFDHIHVGVKRL